jgi:hypothetical protein
MMHESTARKAEKACQLFVNYAIWNLRSDPICDAVSKLWRLAIARTDRTDVSAELREQLEEVAPVTQAVFDGGLPPPPLPKATGLSRLWAKRETMSELIEREGREREYKCMLKHRELIDDLVAAGEEGRKNARRLRLIAWAFLASDLEEGVDVD